MENQPGRRSWWGETFRQRRATFCFLKVQRPAQTYTGALSFLLHLQRVCCGMDRGVENDIEQIVSAFLVFFRPLDA